LLLNPLTGGKEAKKANEIVHAFALSVFILLS